MWPLLPPVGNIPAMVALAAPRPRILLVLLEPHRAGAESVALRVAEHLAAEADVTLATLLDPGRIREGLGWKGPVGEARDLLFGKWDLLHTHLFLPGLLARVRRLWDPDLRWIHTVHYHDYRAVRWGRLKRWLDRRFIFPAADALVAVSPLVARKLATFPRSRTVLNGVVERVAAGPDGSRAPSAPPTLLTTAMLRPEKGIADLLDAVAHLRDQGLSLRLVVAGEGRERKRLEGEAARLGIADRVSFPGFLADLDPLFRDAALYVQPSREESFGMATLEAMAHGLPVVVADGGFLPELVGEGKWGRVARPAPGESRGSALAREIRGALDHLPELAAGARAGWSHWKVQAGEGAMLRGHQEVVRQVLLPRVVMIQPIVTHSPGGLQRQLHLQTRELARLGYRITLLQRRDPHLDRKEWGHVDFVQIPDLPLPPRVRGALFTVGAFLRLFLRHPRPDLYHAHQLYSPTLVGAAAKRLRGGALVAKVTAAGALGEVAQLGRLPFPRLRARAFRQVDRVIALHHAMATELQALQLGGGRPFASGSCRVTIIPNAVELPEPDAGVPPDGSGADEAARGPSSPGTPLSLLWVGRLSTEKGLDLLLGAVERLDGAGVPVTLDLVGGADTHRNVEPELRRRAKELPPGARVYFHGLHSDVTPFYRSRPIFVLPSRSEGMSNALLEAMAHGLPCVVSDIPANLALVEDGRSGLVFSDGDSESLAAALRRLAQNPDLASMLGAGARQRVRAGFTAPAVARRLAALYGEVYQGPILREVPPAEGGGHG